MGTEQDRVACRTPNDPEAKMTRIPKWKYDLISAAIRKVVPPTEPGIAFMADLSDLVTAEIPQAKRKDLGSVGWHVTSVKLEMEVRGELRRVAGVHPQHLVLVQKP